MDVSLQFCSKLNKTSVCYYLGVIATCVWVHLLEIEISCWCFQPGGDFVHVFRGRVCGLRLAWVLKPCVDNIALYQWAS